jgi:hypothetical protein
MNVIKAQLNMCNVGSSLKWPQTQALSDPTRYDVYTEKDVGNHYLWCLDLKRDKLKKRSLSPLTSYDVCADLQAKFQHHSYVEKTHEKLAVAFGFSASVLLVCFSVFLVF